MTHRFALIFLLFSSLAAQSTRPAIDLWLSHLEGDWDIVREIRGTKVSNRATAEWILDRRFLQIHMVDTTPAKAYEAIVTVGYVPEKKQYVAGALSPGEVLASYWVATPMAWRRAVTE